VAVLRLEVLEALRHLFRRTWFSRVWIVQEIVLAKDVAVICGRYSLPGADIAKEFKHHVSSSTATGQAGMKCQSVYGSQKMTRSWDGPPKNLSTCDERQTLKLRRLDHTVRDSPKSHKLPPSMTVMPEVCIIRSRHRKQSLPSSLRK
jgi:hypothetical protein